MYKLDCQLSGNTYIWSLVRKYKDERMVHQKSVDKQDSKSAIRQHHWKYGARSWGTWWATALYDSILKKWPKNLHRKILDAMNNLVHRPWMPASKWMKERNFPAFTYNFGMDQEGHIWPGYSIGTINTCIFSLVSFQKIGATCGNIGVDIQWMHTVNVKMNSM